MADADPTEVELTRIVCLYNCGPSPARCLYGAGLTYNVAPDEATWLLSGGRAYVEGALGELTLTDETKVTHIKDMLQRWRGTGRLEEREDEFDAIVARSDIAIGQAKKAEAEAKREALKQARADAKAAREAAHAARLAARGQGNG